MPKDSTAKSLSHGGAASMTAAPPANSVLAPGATTAATISATANPAAPARTPASAAAHPGGRRSAGLAVSSVMDPAWHAAATQARVVRIPHGIVRIAAKDKAAAAFRLRRPRRRWRQPRESITV
ncbi:hypothetical protein MTP03_03350 [Tsukamurella sp. PLM1]|nr:hypothetical protein MTP03_03350 [Tsukamurella sp. PLM1]